MRNTFNNQGNITTINHAIRETINLNLLNQNINNVVNLPPSGLITPEQFRDLL